MSGSGWPTATTWEEHWRAALRTRSGLSTAALASGDAYARHDRQLDVATEKGVAHAVAGGDRRIVHQIEFTLPVIEDAVWDRLFDRWSTQDETVRSLLSGPLPPGLLLDTEQEGVALLPLAGELGWRCSCAHERVGTRRDPAHHDLDGEARRPCKHVTAALLIFGRQLEDEPFELFTLRGRTRSEIRSRLGALRPELLSSADTAVRADEAWARAVGPCPAPLPRPATPGSLGGFPTDPPPSSPFTAEGLRILVDDAARRAWRMLGGEHETFLELDAPADLARVASELEGTPAWRGLVKRSGLTSQELSARAVAWRRAGTAGVSVHLAHRRAVRVSPTAQLRQSADGCWFRYEKTGGRWLLSEGPAHDPEELLSSAPIAQPSADSPSAVSPSAVSPSAVGPTASVPTTRPAGTLS